MLRQRLKLNVIFLNKIMSNKFIKNMSESKKLKILFWCLSPVLFPAFMRFFWIIFNFVYGAGLVYIFGEEHEGSIFFLTFISSIVFAIGTYRYLYINFKKHFLEE